MTSTIYRAIAGVFTALCVGLQYALTVHGDSLAALGASSLKFFSFFTILTNILAASALLVPLVAPISLVGEFLSRASVLTFVYCYIFIVVKI
jgi:hypothetical protein